MIYQIFITVVTTFIIPIFIIGVIISIILNIITHKRNNHTSSKELMSNITENVKKQLESEKVDSYNTCSYCGSSVEKNSLSCPNCGAKIKKNK